MNSKLLDDVLNETAQALVKAETGKNALAQAKQEGFPDPDLVVHWAERTRRLLLRSHEVAALRVEIGALAGCLRQLLGLSNLSQNLDVEEITRHFFAALPAIGKNIAEDIAAAYAGDPAAKSYGEVLVAYPSVQALAMHRLAHVLYNLGVPVIPRIMAEHSHSQTGIDIHPGAQIGHSFFIDHGTGVVIGETTEIGNRVKLYQGVTLGALSFPRDSSGEMVRGKKRHPTIEDDVTIYAEATILGGDTVIGKGSVIGGNVWLTESVPAGSKVMSGHSDHAVRPKGSK